MLQILGEHEEAARALSEWFRDVASEVQSLRRAVRARQRTFGFANLETKRAAELLADAEGKLHHEAQMGGRGRVLMAGWPCHLVNRSHLARL